MKTTILLSSALWFGFAAQAQNVGIGTVSPIARLHVADSSVLFTGSAILPAMPGAPPQNGAGTRWMWYANKAAMRGGAVSNVFPDSWSQDSVGLYSSALGFDVRAAGNSAMALGYRSSASGLHSVALGDSALSTGKFAAAIGYHVTASGTGAFATGSYTEATAPYSIAIGYSNAAVGAAGTTIGFGVSSLGDYSTTLGHVLTAKAKDGIVLGAYNDISDSPNPTVSNNQDRIFQLGNGQASTRSNAITVLRNGNAGFGTLAPGERIDIYKGRLRFTANPSAGISAGIDFTNVSGTANNGFVGVYNDSLIGLYGYLGAGWKLLFNTANGNLGLQGNNNPRAALSFSNAAGNKIALWGNADGGHYGLGIAASLMQLYTDAASSDIAFGYGNSANFTENMRVKGNGNVGIGTNNPTDKLEVNGNLRSYGNTRVGGTVRIEGGNPTENKVLTASNSSGDATWEFPAQVTSSFNGFLSTSYSLVLGSNYIPFVDLSVPSQPYTGFDLGGNFSNTDYKYTAPAYGFYQFVTKIDLTPRAAVASGNMYLYLQVERAGSAGTYSKTWKFVYQAGSETPYSLDGMANLRLNAGDKVSVVVFCGGNAGDFPIVTNPFGNTSYFSGYRIY